MLNKSLLTGAEQDEILFALQSLKATSASQNSEVFSRLSGLFRKETVDWIDVDFSCWGTGMPSVRFSRCLNSHSGAQSNCFHLL